VPRRTANREGIGGQATRNMMAFEPKARDFGGVVVEYARLGIGKSEQGGDNSGPLVDWLTQTPPEITLPWCAAFVSACWFWASWKLQRVPPFVSWKFGRDGGIDPELYVPTLVSNARNVGRLVGGSPTPSFVRVTPGSMLFVKGGSHGWSHVGIVESVEGGTVNTIEGNVGAKTNGGADWIARLKRQVSSCDYGVS
jgi:hypothetical protein